MRFYPLLVIDNVPIRRSALLTLREANERLAVLQRQWTIFSDHDQPAFKNWYRATFGDLLQEIQDCGLKIYRAQQIIDAVMREAIARGIDFQQAYENVVRGRALPVEETYGDENETAARELFEEELRARGDDPGKFGEGEWEERFARFKAEHGFTPDEEHEETSGAAPEAAPEEVTDRLIRIRALYRKLARRLHPDATESTPAVVAMWLEVQDAYEARDLERLERAWLELNPAEATAQIEREPISALRERIVEALRAAQAVKRRLRGARRDRAWGFSRPALRARRARRAQAAIRRELGQELDEARAALRLLEHYIAGWAEGDQAA